MDYEIDLSRLDENVFPDELLSGLECDVLFFDFGEILVPLPIKSDNELAEVLSNYMLLGYDRTSSVTSFEDYGTKGMVYVNAGEKIVRKLTNMVSGRIGYENDEL